MIRLTPEEYFTNHSQNWFPIIVAIALIGSFAVALYAISKLGDKKC